MRVHQLLTATLLLLLSFVSLECQAAPHARDGFYVQLATGIGGTKYWSTAHNPYYEPAIDYTNHQGGLGLTGSLLLGFQLRPGLALGVGGYASAHALSSPNRTENGYPVTWEDSGGPYLQLLGTVGPFVDYYPSAALGWHVQALVGYASLGAGDFSRKAPSGIGLMAGVGHDWWVSDRFSVGVLARLVYANGNATAEPYPDSGGSPSEHASVISPSLDASVTFH
jgi:hypothetical protein